MPDPWDLAWADGDYRNAVSAAARHRRTLYPSEADDIVALDKMGDISYRMAMDPLANEGRSRCGAQRAREVLRRAHHQSTSRRNAGRFWVEEATDGENPLD